MMRLENLSKHWLMKIVRGCSWLLLIVFTTLKLLNVIDWSWWWVISPILPFLVCLVIGVILLFVADPIADVVEGAQEGWSKYKRARR
jgi:hypothetical protein